MRRLLLLLLLAVLILLPVPLAAQETTVVTGQVRNATTGGTLPQDMQVRLHVIRGQSDVDTRTASLAKDGAFRFEGVPVNAEAAYLLVAQHEDVFYSTQFDPSKEQGPINLTIFDTTASDERLRVHSSVVMLVAADAKERLASFLEIHTVENHGDRTFVPNLGGTAMPTLLRFSLPPNFQDLDVRVALPEGELLEVDRGFAITVPVPPGQHEVMFSYRAPYTDGALTFERTFPLPTGSFRLLVPEDIGQVQAEGLQQGSPATIAGRSHRVLEGEDLARGAAVSLTLSGLPQPSLLQRAAEPFEGTGAVVGVTSVAGVLLAGLLAYALFLRRRRAPAPVAESPVGGATPEAGYGDLVTAMADLDDRFARGEVPQEQYEAERTNLKARLVAARLQQENL